jgi:hypothetical protein
VRAARGPLLAPPAAAPLSRSMPAPLDIDGLVNFPEEGLTPTTEVEGVKPLVGFPSAPAGEDVLGSPSTSTVTPSSDRKRPRAILTRESVNGSCNPSSRVRELLASSSFLHDSTVPGYGWHDAHGNTPLSLSRPRSWSSQVVPAPCGVAGFTDRRVWACADSATWCPFRRILQSADDPYSSARGRSANRGGGPPRILDLPIETVLRIFTLSADDNLLVGAARCTNVWSEWWLALRGTTACGHGVFDRSTILAKISRALSTQELHLSGQVQLSGVALGDAGSKALGAALSALPVARGPRFPGPQVLDLRQCDISSAGMAAIADAVVCCMRSYY